MFGKVVSPDNQHSAESKDPRTGFNYLKRDLVRLLGILSFENREVQDRVRECEQKKAPFDSQYSRLPVRWPPLHLLSYWGTRPEAASFKISQFK